MNIKGELFEPKCFMTADSSVHFSHDALSTSNYQTAEDKCGEVLNKNYKLNVLLLSLNSTSW